MKSLFIIPALLLGMIPMDAEAKILPNLYASEYCSLRSMGVSRAEAMAAAVDASSISQQDMFVTIDGERYEVGVVKAARAVSERCPQYLN